MTQLFVTLRSLLSQEPSREDFSRILAYLAATYDVKSRALGIAYAQEHLESWPDAQREPIWQIVSLGSLFVGIKPGPVFALVRSLRFGHKPHKLVSFFSSPHLRDLRGLHFIDSIGTKGFVSLASSLPQNLTTLTFRKCALGPSALEALANTPNFAKLEHLGLSYGQFDARGAQLLANSPYLTNLTTLDLSCNPIGAQGVQLLANSPNFARLKDLDLSRSHIDLQGVQALANSPYLHNNLETLNLSSCKLGPESADALANASCLHNLTTLRIGGNSFGAQGKQLLAFSKSLRASVRLPFLKHLERKELYAEATHRGIRGRSKMNKAALVEALLRH